jgi:hypothetical protein
VLKDVGKLDETLARGGYESQTWTRDVEELLKTNMGEESALEVEGGEDLDNDDPNKKNIRDDKVGGV